MNFNIRGENINITPSLRDYTEKKINKLEKYFDPAALSEVRVNMRVHNNEQVVEVTIPVQGLLLRAEDTHDDMYAAIDLVVTKLDRQIKKYKTRVNRKNRQEIRDAQRESLGSIAATSVIDTNETKVEHEEPEFELVRKKRFFLKPMDAEEAILQMTMLGHTFFVFTNAENGQTNVVYRRKDGRYGVIEPE